VAIKIKKARLIKLTTRIVAAGIAGLLPIDVGRMVPPTAARLALAQTGVRRRDWTPLTPP
jgi:hypothetical protein